MYEYVFLVMCVFMCARKALLNLLCFYRILKKKEKRNFDLKGWNRKHAAEHIELQSTRYQLDVCLAINAHRVIKRVADAKIIPESGSHLCNSYGYGIMHCQSRNTWTKPRLLSWDTRTASWERQLLPGWIFCKSGSGCSLENRVNVVMLDNDLTIRRFESADRR